MVPAFIEASQAELRAFTGRLEMSVLKMLLAGNTVQATGEGEGEGCGDGRGDGEGPALGEGDGARDGDGDGSGAGDGDWDGDGDGQPCLLQCAAPTTAAALACETTPPPQAVTSSSAPSAAKHFTIRSTGRGALTLLRQTAETTAGDAAGRRNRATSAGMSSSSSWSGTQAAKPCSW